MAGVRKKLGSLLGPQGVKGDKGDLGDTGLPGVNAVANDEATATYIMQTSETQAAVDARFLEVLGQRLVKSALPPDAPTVDTIWVNTSAVDPGVIARFDASTLAFADGSTIGSWPDVMGGAPLIGSAQYVAASPKFGGMPAIRFDGISQYLDNALTIPDESSVIIVAALTAVLSTTQVILSTSTGDFGRMSSVWVQGSETSWKSTRSGGEPVTAVQRDTAARVHGISYSASGDIYRLGGVTAQYPPSAPYTRGGVRIGRGADGSPATAYEVAELIVFDRALSAVELAERVTAISEKWGL